ncbi:YopJ/AvrA family T3SS effector serine/threonine acetyltransferase [Bartonella taylorii]|uniref:YopJ/AvrA family T3SS effector serine/threonine acetyltransferase n=1 Tax=Bartonella taylorii TaxID=33046 RepID=UPI001ABBC844|nr:YopJ/AvrA family T3SS effector serine/threonine acetyltransferase [Bartonella taylorii]
MKPHNLKNTAHSSSQMQGGACANESLESFPASSENSAAKEEGSVVFDHGKLESVISELESDLASDRWIDGDYAESDLEMMPSLIKQANLKYPEMKLNFVRAPEDFSLSLKETLDNGVQSSRYIVNTGMSIIHFAVIDHQTIDGKTSLILFDSTKFDNIGSIAVKLGIQESLQDCPLSDYHFSMVEMDIQRSFSECGIFSLFFAKKLHTESNKLMRMHQDNISGVLCKPNTPVPPEIVDQYLPPKFYKHTQGVRRLREYIKSNPGSENEKVNKKGETLPKRFEKTLVELAGNAVSVSAHRKRTREYKSLMMSF